jgi:hypothetical protein
MAETKWIVIAESDLNDYQVAAIMDALKSAALATGQTDPFARVMPDIASRIRAEVRGCKTNTVSNLTNSIPPDLKWVAVYLIIEAMQSRLPGVALDEGIKNIIADAKKYLQRVSECKVPIAQPDDPQIPPDVQPASGTPLITVPEREFDRCSQDGI